jgi:hypothetical protein
MGRYSSEINIAVVVTVAVTGIEVTIAVSISADEPLFGRSFDCTGVLSEQSEIEGEIMSEPANNGTEFLSNQLHGIAKDVFHCSNSELTLTERAYLVRQLAR